MVFMKGLTIDHIETGVVAKFTAFVLLEVLASENKEYYELLEHSALCSIEFNCGITRHIIFHNLSRYVSPLFIFFTSKIYRVGNEPINI